MLDELPQVRSTIDPVDYDPKIPLADPYPIYRALRERDPVYWNAGSKMWVVTGYEPIREAVRDDETYHQAYVRREVSRSGEQVHQRPYFQAFRRMFFLMDGPDHQRVRPLFIKWFMGPTRMRVLTPMVEQAAREVVEAISGGGSFDVVRDFAYPLPLRIISALLGVPAQDSVAIAHDIHAIIAVVESVPKSPEVRARADAAIVRVQDYFRDLVVSRRGAMGDDLLSSMIESYDAGSFADEEELLANILLMYFAGHETTTDTLSLAVLALHRNPDQLALLRKTPELMRSAVDELLRYDSTAQGFARSPCRDVTLGGKDIPAHSFILLLIAAGNRDPAVFENPDQLILSRATNRALSFGGGAHLCIGNMLARAELGSGLAELLRQMPKLELETTEPDPSAFKPSMTRGLLTLKAHS